jgi:putative hydrolase of the HAD superfamily
MEPRPEAVFLDLGDTLVRAHPSWASVYLSTFPEFGIEATEEQLEEALRTATRSGAWEFEGPFEATEEGSWERIKAFDLEVLAALGHADVPEEFIRSIERAFAERSAWYIFPDVAPSLDALREAGFRLAIVSNWPWGAPELLHSLELARHFESLIISARVGYQKPHARIFEHALDQLGVPARRTVHVGDSYRADVLGARAAGITPILIDRSVGDASRIEAAAPADDDVPVIADLFGLLDLLGVERPAVAHAL